MLKQSDVETEAEATPTAQVRVTPKELSRALAAIESRKEAKTRYRSETIPVAEAVHELGLEVSPEEVLAEVQEGRRSATAGKMRPSFGRRLVLSLTLCGIMLGLMSVEAGSGYLDYRASHHLHVDPEHLQVGTSSGKWMLFSEVGDNQPVQCSYNGGTFVQTNPSQPSWTLIKHAGQVYIRGFIPQLSQQALQANGTDIYCSGSTVPVTLPLSSLQITPQGGDSGTFHIESLQMDQHAHEKWQP